MPAVDLAVGIAPSANSGQALDNSSLPDREHGGNDFDSLMQSKLSPHPSKVAAKKPLVTVQASATTNIASSSDAATDTTGTAAKQIPTKSESPGKTAAPDAAGKDGAGQNVPVATTDTVVPVSTYFPLSLFAAPTNAFSPATGNVSPVSSEAPGKVGDVEISTPTALAATAPVPAIAITADVSKLELQPLPSNVAALATSFPEKNVVQPTALPATTTATTVKGASQPALDIAGLTPIPLEMQPVSATEPTAEKSEPLHLAPAAADILTATSPVVAPTNEAANFTKVQAPATPTDPLQAFQQRAAAETGNRITEAGTGVAINAVQMKNPQKTIKVAGPDAQVLPVDDSNGAREKILPAARVVSATRATDNRGDFNFSFANGNSQASPVDRATTLNTLDLPSLAEARMRSVDRTHDMVALHAMRLVESKSDTLAVVIKPAVGTELSLELRQRAGGIEAQATLTRGDHQFLSQHWPELQQRLEQRGIKLAPLGSESNFFTDGNSQFQRQHASQEDAAQQASAFAEFASLAIATAPHAQLAVTHDGWESWA